jgi:molybdate transport system regulatory protein
MGEPTGRGRATLVEGDVEFGSDDAALLEAIGRTGSVARAAKTLGRSRARALRRIKRLEEGFGDLVERQRGGRGGGGSKLTETGRALFGRYDRLSAAVAAAAGVPDTVIGGVVEAVDGELAAVDTAVGTVWGRHEGLSVDEHAQIRIGADAVTVQPTDDQVPGETSARNRRRGRVTGIDRGETVHTVHVAVDGETVRALVTDESARRLALNKDTAVWLSWKATATRLVADAVG